MTIQIETTICKECGSDTEIDRRIDRLGFDGNVLDTWLCGICHDIWNNAVIWYDKDGKIIGRGDDEDPRWDDRGEELENSYEFNRGHDDEMEAKFKKKRWAEVDLMFPDAPRFRKLASIVEDEQQLYTKADFLKLVQELQTLVGNYRYNKDAPKGVWNTASEVLDNALQGEV